MTTANELDELDIFIKETLSRIASALQIMMEKAIKESKKQPIEYFYSIATILSQLILQHIESANIYYNLDKIEYFESIINNMREMINLLEQSSKH